MIQLAARKFNLVQIGYARVPALEAQTELSYATRLIQAEAESGGMHDYYASRFSPVGIGKLRHSGLYPLCRSQQGIADNVYIRDELDQIQVARSVWTPFLFYANILIADRNNLLTPNCGQFLWAYGKVTSITSTHSVNDYLSPKATPVDIEATLRTPLVPATYSRWRFGAALDLSVERRVILADLENASAESPALWFVPCEVPSFCNDERFWPRNVYEDNFNTGSVEYDAAKWECPYLMFRYASSDLITVSGNTQPRTRIVMSGDASITIRNAIGTSIYFYNRPIDSTIYLDSWTGVAIEKDIAGNISQVPSAGYPPQLTYSDNYVSVDGSFVTIGWTEAWIN